MHVCASRRNVMRIWCRSWNRFENREIRLGTASWSMRVVAEPAAFAKWISRSRSLASRYTLSESISRICVSAGLRFKFQVSSRAIARWIAVAHASRSLDTWSHALSFRKSVMYTVCSSECNFHRLFIQFVATYSQERSDVNRMCISLGPVVNRNLNLCFYASVRYRKRVRWALPRGWFRVSSIGPEWFVESFYALVPWWVGRGANARGRKRKGEKEKGNESTTTENRLRDN